MVQLYRSILDRKAHLRPGVECASARSCLISSIIPLLLGQGDVPSERLYSASLKKLPGI